MFLLLSLIRSYKAGRPATFFIVRRILIKMLMAFGIIIMALIGSLGMPSPFRAPPAWLPLIKTRIRLEQESRRLEKFQFPTVFFWLTSVYLVAIRREPALAGSTSK